MTIKIMDNNNKTNALFDIKCVSGPGEKLSPMATAIKTGKQAPNIKRVIIHKNRKSLVNVLKSNGIK